MKVTASSTACQSHARNASMVETPQDRQSVPVFTWTLVVSPSHSLVMAPHVGRFGGAILALFAKVRATHVAKEYTRLLPIGKRHPVSMASNHLPWPRSSHPRLSIVGRFCSSVPRPNGQRHSPLDHLRPGYRPYTTRQTALCPRPVLLVDCSQAPAVPLRCPRTSVADRAEDMGAAQRSPACPIHVRSQRPARHLTAVCCIPDFVLPCHAVNPLPRACPTQRRLRSHTRGAGCRRRRRELATHSVNLLPLS
jgi:hypothetical protein